MGTDTINQLVARNLTAIRKKRGLIQKEAKVKLQAEGLDWELPTLSLAERAAGDPSGRRFTVADVVAMARAFNVPLTWFFLPDHESRDGVSATVDGPTLHPAELIGSVLKVSPEVDERLKEVEAAPEVAENIRNLVLDVIERQLRGAGSEPLEQLRGLHNLAHSFTQMIERTYLDTIAELKARGDSIHQTDQETENNDGE